MKVSSIPLCQRTDEADEAKILYEKGKLIVKYDYYDEDGKFAGWAEVSFNECMFYRFFDSPCCEVEHILSPREIQRKDISELLELLLPKWQESVGWEEYQQQLGGAGRFSHYTVFFDHVGALDVIASGCSVESR